jgi:hypothetical protein
MDEGAQLPLIMLYSFQVRGDPVFRRDKGDIHVDAVLNVTQVIWSILCFCDLCLFMCIDNVKWKY